MTRSPTLLITCLTLFGSLHAGCSKGPYVPRDVKADSIAVGDIRDNLDVAGTTDAQVDTATLAQPTGFATLKGQFLYGKQGTKIPNALKITPTKDVQVCGKHQLFDESLVVNPKNRGIQNIILWLSMKPRPKVHPGYQATADNIITMNNTGCRFEPHVVVVRTSQTFRIGNTDPIGHNSLINFLKNLGVNPIIPGGGHVDFNPRIAEIIPTPVSCSIHPWMSGVVLVQDHPYMAVTDEDGRFELKDLPAGKLTIKVWQEKTGYVDEVINDGKKESWRRGRYIVDLKAGKDQEHEFIVDPSQFGS